MEAPKRIWAEYNQSSASWVVSSGPMACPEYIRADLVEGLVECLPGPIDKLDHCEFGTTPDGYETADWKLFVVPVIAALAAFREASK